MPALTHSALSLLKTRRGIPGSTLSNVDRPHEMNRYMGGHRRVNQPYVSGYWYCIIEPPHALFNHTNSSEMRFKLDTQQAMEGHGQHLYTETNPGGDGPYTTNMYSPYETTRWLHSAAESFTPPTRNLTVVDLPGMGAQGSSYVAGQTLDRKFSVAFREYQNTPIKNIMDTWTSGIDQHYGVSPLNGNEFIPANYKGAAWVFLCKPSMSNDYGGNNIMAINHRDVEQFFFFEGVIPEATPFDSFDSDISSNDLLQISVSFSFDGWPYTKEYHNHFDEGLRRLNLVYDQNLEGTFNQHIKANTAPELYDFPFAGFHKDRIVPGEELNHRVHISESQS